METSGLSVRRVWFSDFYPADYGHLAADNKDPQADVLDLSRKGLNVQFPDDPKITSKIRVKFFMLNQKIEEK